MPLDRLVLIVLAALAAAGLTVLVGAWAVSAWQLPAFALASAVPGLLVLYVVWRVIADRVRDAADDPYDRVEK